MRTPFAPVLTCLAVTALTGALRAQTPPEVLALTDAPAMLARITPGTCTTTLCTPPLTPVIPPYAGGAAHDPRDRATWLSNGTDLCKVDARTGCATVCAPFPAPNLPAGVFVTGLACNEETQRLFVAHSDNTIHTYAASGCSLTWLSSCTLSVPTNHIVSGLATFDAQQRLFYATSPWAGPGIDAQIYIANQSAPCVPLCPPQFLVDITGVSVPFVTGLGFEPCRRTLEATDGTRLITSSFQAPCTLLPITECPAIVAGVRAVGLCVLPSTETASGSPCFNGSAPTCPTMQHVLRGDPTIGNLGFALDLVNCPAPSIAMAFLDIGSNCATTNYGLCSLMPATPLWASMQFPTGTGCNGFASFGIPIPNTTALCGIILSSRWAGWMVGGGPPDHFVSECQTWMISGS